MPAKYNLWVCRTRNLVSAKICTFKVTKKKVKPYSKFVSKKNVFKTNGNFKKKKKREKKRRKKKKKERKLRGQSELRKNLR